MRKLEFALGKMEVQKKMDLDEIPVDILKALSEKNKKVLQQVTLIIHIKKR